VARYGQHRVFRTVGTLRAVWLIGLAFIGPGVAGLLTVMAVELAIIISMSLFNPVQATYRFEHTPKDRIARTLSAGSIGQQASIAIFTALGGLLAAITSPRAALTVIGLLIFASPLLLPRRHHTPHSESELAVSDTLPSRRRSCERRRSNTARNAIDRTYTLRVFSQV
jgi:MFS family permease